MTSDVKAKENIIVFEIMSLKNNAKSVKSIADAYASPSEA